MNSKASLCIFHSTAPGRSGMKPDVNKLSDIGGEKALLCFFLKPKAFANQ